MTFTCSWENPGQTNLFTVNALVGVTAIFVAWVDGYFWPNLVHRPFSAIGGQVTLGITMIQNGQVIVPPTESSQSQDFANVYTEGEWPEQETITSKDVFRTCIVPYDGLLVPANARVEFSLSCEVSVNTASGGAQFVAAGNGRQITAPGVIISTQPWIIQRGAGS